MKNVIIVVLSARGQRVHYINPNEKHNNGL